MEDFISHNMGATEPGILIITTAAEEENALAFLTQHAFLDAHTFTHEGLAQSLTQGVHIFFSTEYVKQNAALCYDLLQGYASGALRSDDQTLNPAYSRNNLIMVLQQGFITAESDAGREWLTLCGMALHYTA